MLLSTAALGLSRAPTPSQMKTGSRRQYILHNKTDNDIARKLKTSIGSKSALDTVNSLQEFELDIESPDNIDLHLLARTIKELTTQKSGAWASYCTILKAISMLMVKLADDQLQMNPPSNDIQSGQQEDITDHMCQMNKRMFHQENKINILSNTTEKIMKAIQKISENTDAITHPTLVVVKPTYALVVVPTVPAKHMDVIIYYKNKTRQILIKV